jgi:hypothetical protein
VIVTVITLPMMLALYVSLRSTASICTLPHIARVANTLSGYFLYVQTLQQCLGFGVLAVSWKIRAIAYWYTCSKHMYRQFLHTDCVWRITSPNECASPRQPNFFLYTLSEKKLSITLRVSLGNFWYLTEGRVNWTMGKAPALTCTCLGRAVMLAW